MNYRVTIAPVSSGTTEEDNSIKRGTTDTRSIAGPAVAVFSATDTQIKNLRNYVAEIKAGIDTSSVETAIAAIL